MNAAAKYFSDVYSAVASTLAGMAVTGRTAFKKPVTELYPHTKYVPGDRYRGVLFNKISDCSGCAACARACPVNCITVETCRRDPEDFGTASDGTPMKLWVTRFDIDESLCMFCGLCTEPCPTQALIMTKQYEMATANKSDLHLSFAVDGHRAEEAARKAAEKKKAEAAAAAAAAAQAPAEAAPAVPAAPKPVPPAAPAGGESKEEPAT
jgi:formate hydrogenlyase subunit 6/NADH:ubiquinone oxidoreductase subunit I